MLKTIDFKVFYYYFIGESLSWSSSVIFVTSSVRIVFTVALARKYEYPDIDMVMEVRKNKLYPQLYTCHADHGIGKLVKSVPRHTFSAGI